MARWSCLRGLMTVFWPVVLEGGRDSMHQCELPYMALKYSGGDQTSENFKFK